MCLPTAWHHQAFQLQKAAALSFLIIFLRLCLHMVATKVVACECVDRFSILIFHADFFRTLSDLQRPSLRRCHRSCKCSGRREHHRYGVVCWCEIRHEEGQFVFCGELVLGIHTQHFINMCIGHHSDFVSCERIYGILGLSRNCFGKLTVYLSQIGRSLCSQNSDGCIRLVVIPDNFIPNTREC
jgi:hypothetical protein